jgi:cyclopropane fatty-acyl-phospholipid synthase-like methyltransferase
MTFLTQRSFPALWKLFQLTVGGTIDKRKLCILKYAGQKHILEVGCSLGNIARIFHSFPDVSYTGIDLDPVVIRYAQRDFFRHSNFRFLALPLNEFSKSTEEQFDYILFAGIFHHIDDELCRKMLEDVQRLMPSYGRLMVVDPLMPESEDGRFIHWFLKLEQGKYVRKQAELLWLLRGIPGLHMEAAETHFVGATPWSIPRCARFGVFLLSKTLN